MESNSRVVVGNVYDKGSSGNTEVVVGVNIRKCDGELPAGLVDVVVDKNVAQLIEANALRENKPSTRRRMICVNIVSRLNPIVDRDIFSNVE